LKLQNPLSFSVFGIPYDSLDVRSAHHQESTYTGQHRKIYIQPCLHQNSKPVFQGPNIVPSSGKVDKRGTFHN